VNKEQIVTILILMGLVGGLVGGPIASLLDYHAPPVKRFWLFIIYSRIHWIYMHRHNGILWKIKEEKAMMTEICTDILRFFRSYRLSSTSNDFIILREIK
jgi:hypothetical protein